MNLYHGHNRPQLFNLETDSGEWNDRAVDASFSQIRNELLAEVRADWSGEMVLNTLETTQNDYQVLEEFGRNAHISTEDGPDLWTAPDGCNVFPEI